MVCACLSPHWPVKRRPACGDDGSFACVMVTRRSAMPQPLRLLGLLRAADTVNPQPGECDSPKIDTAPAVSLAGEPGRCLVRAAAASATAASDQPRRALRMGAIALGAPRPVACHVATRPSCHGHEPAEPLRKGSSPSPAAGLLARCVLAARDRRPAPPLSLPAAALGLPKGACGSRGRRHGRRAGPR